MLASDWSDQRYLFYSRVRILGSYLFLNIQGITQPVTLGAAQTNNNALDSLHCVSSATRAAHRHLRETLDVSQAYDSSHSYGHDFVDQQEGIAARLFNLGD